MHSSQAGASSTATGRVNSAGGLPSKPSCPTAAAHAPGLAARMAVSGGSPGGGGPDSVGLGTGWFRQRNMAPNSMPHAPAWRNDEASCPTRARRSTWDRAQPYRLIRTASQLPRTRPPGLSRKKQEQRQQGPAGNPRVAPPVEKRKEDPDRPHEIHRQRERRALSQGRQEDEEFVVVRHGQPRLQRLRALGTGPVANGQSVGR